MLAKYFYNTFPEQASRGATPNDRRFANRRQDSKISFSSPAVQQSRWHIFPATIISARLALQAKDQAQSAQRSKILSPREAYFSNHSKARLCF